MRVHDQYGHYRAARDEARQLNGATGTSYYVLAVGNKWIVAEVLPGEEIRQGFTIIATPTELRYSSR